MVEVALAPVELHLALVEAQAFEVDVVALLLELRP